MDGRTVVVQDQVSPEHLDSLTAQVTPVPVPQRALAGLSVRHRWRQCESITPSRAAALPMPSVAAVFPFLSDRAETMPSNPWSTLIRYRSRMKSLLPSTVIHLIRYRACLVPDARMRFVTANHSPFARPTSLREASPDRSWRET
jgi:hypothetical protein